MSSGNKEAREVWTWGTWGSRAVADAQWLVQPASVTAQWSWSSSSSWPDLCPARCPAASEGWASRPGRRPPPGSAPPAWPPPRCLVPSHLPRGGGESVHTRSFRKPINNLKVKSSRTNLKQPAGKCRTSGCILHRPTLHQSGRPWGSDGTFQQTPVHHSTLSLFGASFALFWKRLLDKMYLSHIWKIQHYKIRLGQQKYFVFKDSVLCFYCFYQLIKWNKLDSLIYESQCLNKSCFALRRCTDSRNESKCSIFATALVINKTTSVLLPVNILAVCRHLPQLLLPHILHDNHGADPEHIGEAKVDDAVGRLVIATWQKERKKKTQKLLHGNRVRLHRRDPVCTCTSALLVVVLHGLADGVMDDEPHVGFVDAHAKSHRGHDHLQPQQGASAVSYKEISSLSIWN